MYGAFDGICKGMNIKEPRVVSFFLLLNYRYNILLIMRVR